MSRRLKKVIVYGVVIPIVALVAVGSAVIWTIDGRMVREQRDALAHAPPGWMDSLRTNATLPAEVEALVLPRTEDGDAAALVQRSTNGTVSLPQADVEEAYQRLYNGEEATSADSVVWLAVAADTTLDLLVTAARHSRWRGVELSVPEGLTAETVGLFDLRSLDDWALSGAGHRLAIRARVRLVGGDRRGAYEDLQAIMGLGELMERRHMSLYRVGSMFVSIAAKELGHYSQVVGDTALARAAGSAEAWAEAEKVVGWYALGAAPDSALALAQDPTLLLGWRGRALLTFTFARSRRLRVRLFGFPKHVTDELERLAGDPDPDFAHFAQVVSRTVDGFNDLSLLQRYAEERYLALLELMGP